MQPPFDFSFLIAEPDFAVKADFQPSVVLDGDLRGIDQVGPRIARLDRLGGEFALRGDPHDAPRVVDAAVAAEVGRDGHLLPEFQPGQLVRGEVGPQVDAVEVGDLHQRTPHRRQFPGFAVFGQHRPRDGRRDAALRQLVLDPGDLQVDGRGVFVDRRGVVAER